LTADLNDIKQRRQPASSSSRLVAQVERKSKRAGKVRTIMDLSSYASKKYIKLEDVADRPLRKTIVGVEIGQYDRPVITFSDRSQFTVNGTNTNTLIDAFGSTESESLVGEQIELYAGTIRYQGADKPSVLVRAVSQGKKPKPEFEDEVPF
jgi:hypothetical protein